MNPTAKTPEFHSSVTQCLEILELRGACTRSSVFGCTDDEIALVANDNRCQLPVIYRDFLRLMGRGAGSYYLGSDHFFPLLLGNKEHALALVSRDKAGLILPDDAVVFSMHQGYQFLFFQTTEGPDPPVYRYFQARGVFETVYPCFSTFLISTAYEFTL